jgi:ribonucleoside-diphosphate reductase alpha chain
MRFDPEGITQNPEIPFAKSMPDYIMRWLASRFLDTDTQEELGILTPEVRARKMAEDAAMSVGSDTAGPSNGGHGMTGASATGGASPTSRADADASRAARADRPQAAAGTPGVPTVAGSQPATTRAAADAMPDAPPVVPARMAGLDLGPACNQCGGMMQRTGSCYTCSSCGNNTGCG